MTKNALSQAMLEASASGDMEGWVRALESGASLFETDLAGQNALLCAVSGGHDDLALLVAGRMLEAAPTKAWLKTTLKGGYNAFHLAVLNRRHRVLAALTALLAPEERVGVLAQGNGSSKETPFQLAARENATKSLSILGKSCPEGVLLRSGAENLAALDVAIVADKEDAVAWLLTQGAPLETPDPSIPSAWTWVQTPGMLSLLAKHLDWSSVRSASSGTLLHVLLHRGKALRTTLLKSALRQPGLTELLNAVDDRGRTPLQIALCANVSPAIVDLLIEHDVEWGIPNMEGEASTQVLEQQVESGWGLPSETVDKWLAAAKGQRLKKVFAEKELVSVGIKRF